MLFLFPLRVRNFISICQTMCSESSALGLYSNSTFLLVYTHPERQQVIMAQVVGPCDPCCKRPGLSFWLLALVRPCTSCCRHLESKPANGIFLSACLCLCLFASQINNNNKKAFKDFQLQICPLAMSAIHSFYWCLFSSHVFNFQEFFLILWLFLSQRSQFLYYEHFILWECQLNFYLSFFLTCWISQDPGRKRMAHSNAVTDTSLTKELFTKV